MKVKIISILLGVMIWQGVSMQVNHALLLPSPLDCGIQILSLLKTESLYQSLVHTLWRAHLGFFLSFLLGFSFAFVSFRYPILEKIIAPYIALIQTIPQLSFIILFLFWFSRETTLLLVVFFLIFPLAYVELLEGFKAIHQDYLDLIEMSQHHVAYLLKKAYIPLIWSNIQSVLLSGLPLSLKVSVMAEVLVSSQKGIGFSLFYAKNNLDMVTVFSYTIILVLIVITEMHLLSYFRRK